MVVTVVGVVFKTYKRHKCIVTLSPTSTIVNGDIALVDASSHLDLDLWYTPSAPAPFSFLKYGFMHGPCGFQDAHNVTIHNTRTTSITRPLATCVRASWLVVVDGRAGIGVPVARTRRRTFIHGASSSAPTSVHAGRICAARVAAARIEYTSGYFKVCRAWCSAHVLRRLLVSRRSAALAYRPGFAAVAPEGQA